MDCRINVNWTPENEYEPDWREMTRNEYQHSWGVGDDEWDELVCEGAIIPVENVEVRRGSTPTTQSDGRKPSPLTDC